MGLRKKNESWFIDYWHQGKRYRRKIGPSRKQAELALNKIRVSIAENKFLDVKKQQKILFEDMAKDYITRYSRLNKRSFLRDETSIKHLAPFFGKKHLYEITPQIIEDYKAKRIAEQCAHATVNRELALMKHIYSKAMEWGRASENPVKKIKLFKENNQRVRFLESAEIKILSNACSATLKPIVLVALNTGMRQGEILSLIWDDIDLIRGIITVRNTKNNERRFIPMNTIVRDAFEHLKTKRAAGVPFVFPNPHGLRIRGTSVTHMFGKTAKAAGINDFRFHDLRHTFASHLVMSGADIMTVKELLGHKTLEMTLRYSHLSPDFKRSTVELLCGKMDTFWTLGERKELKKKETTLKNTCISNTFNDNAPIAQLVEQRTLNP